MFPALAEWGSSHPSFSLPTQRCFSLISRSRDELELFSAYAEVFPGAPSTSLLPDAFLCLRRGVSLLDPRDQSFGVFSLPTQRCFLTRTTKPMSGSLFSAYAEVFPFYSQSKRAPPPFLCLRRGVSAKSSETASAASFSLPTQRCFSGSNSAPVDAATFLCLRRGVSFLSEKFGSYHDFSLPTQRCFQRLLRLPDPWRLFSAYAEVFPPPKSLGRSPRTFLCLRRGVSYITEPAEQMDTLFSAYAEVFLA